MVNISYSVRSVGTRSLDRIRRIMKVFKDTTFLRWLLPTETYIQEANKQDYMSQAVYKPHLPKYNM